MRSQLAVGILLLSASVVLAQTAPSSAPGTSHATKPAAAPSTPAPTAQKETAATPAKPATTIPPDTAVIIIKGECPAAPASKTATSKAAPANCKSQVTRAEFEKLINALNPDMPPNMRQSFAQNYGKLLLIANEARKRGIQNDPSIQTMMEFAKLQVLAQELGKRLQKQANDVPQSAVDAYYKEHVKDFETADLQRVIVPKPTASKEKPVDETAEKAFADKIRERWVAGEDPTKLQAEAYEHAANKVQPPPVDLGGRRRGAVQAEIPVFDLKAGEVSQPINNQSAFFIYKLVTKETAPLAQVQDEIKRTLSGQRLQTEMDKVTKAGEVEMNDSYFGTTPKPASAAKPAGTTKPAPSTPPAGAAPKTVN